MRISVLRFSLAVIVALAPLVYAATAHGSTITAGATHVRPVNRAVWQNPCGKKLYRCVTVNANNPPVDVPVGVECGAGCDYTEWWAYAYRKVRGHHLVSTSNIKASIEQWVEGGGNDVYISTLDTKGSPINKYVVEVGGCNTNASPSECVSYNVGVTIQKSTGSARAVPVLHLSR